MDDFDKYIRMRDQGTRPEQVYQTAKADGLDEITLIRLVRKVFNLSLGEAKRVSGVTDLLNAKQQVVPGASVYWSGWTTLEGAYLMKATVQSVENGIAHLTDHKKFRLTPDGLQEAAVDQPVYATLRASHLEKPLGEQMAETLKFVIELRDGRPVVA
jgi:hypothetical protein